MQGQTVLVSLIQWSAAWSMWVQKSKLRITLHVQPYSCCKTGLLKCTCLSTCSWNVYLPILSTALQSNYDTERTATECMYSTLKMNACFYIMYMANSLSMSIWQHCFVYFHFNQPYYKQTDVLALVFLTPEILARVYIWHIVHKQLCPVFMKYQINGYYKYISDIFIIFNQNKTYLDESMAEFKKGIKYCLRHIT